MKTTNTYKIPIDIANVTLTSKEGIAHVGDLVHSIDYDAPIGTPIYAARDGVVVFVKSDSDRGGDDPVFEEHANYIEILHDNNEVSEYEHILKNSAKVKAGGTVKAGEQIAEVGNTGWSECPHLHFMVYGKDEEYITREVRFE
jgi:murein DD-endopeptidase MepM/ murein hydrolase activator NlpD